MRAFLKLVVCTTLPLCIAAQGQKVGYITTVAGTGVSGFSGDGGLSTSAEIFYAFGVVVDKAGNFYIADTGSNRIRKVNISTYVITTVAGSSKSGLLRR